MCRVVEHTLLNVEGRIQFWTNEIRSLENKITAGYSVELCRRSMEINRKLLRYWENYKSKYYGKLEEETGTSVQAV